MFDLTARTGAGTHLVRLAETPAVEAAAGIVDRALGRPPALR